MKRHAVHRSRHTVFTDAVMNEAAAVIVGGQRLGLACVGIVRPGQVGRTADRFRHNAVDDFECHLRRLAGGNLRLVFREFFLVLGDRCIEAAGDFAREAAFEGDAGLRRGFGQTGFPCLAFLDGAQAGEAPGVENVRRNGKCFGFPAERLAGGSDFVRAEWRAVGGLGAGLGRCAEADGRLAGDERRLVGFLRGLDGAGNRFGIVAVDVDRVPAGGCEARKLIGGIRECYRSVDRDAVIVPEDDELVELEVARQRNRFLADAFHQAAVACEHIGIVIHEVFAELGAKMRFGDRHADRVADTLAERAGRRLDAGCVTIFRVTGGRCAKLAEILDILDGDIVVAREIEQRVQEHRAVTGRKHETVAISPVGLLGVERQVSGEKDGCDIRCAHGEARVSGVCLLDCVHGQKPDRIGHPVVFFA